MCSVVVQIYAAERNAMWSKKCCGVACLVKDNPQRSYFIRIYDIKVKTVPLPYLVYILLFISYENVES